MSDICSFANRLYQTESCGYCTSVYKNPNCPTWSTKYMCDYKTYANLDMFPFKNDTQLEIIDSLTPNMTELSTNEGIDTTKVSWFNITQCINESTGNFFKKEDVIDLGFSPTYPIGGLYLNNTFKTPEYPLFVEYYINPCLFTVIFIISFIVALLVDYRNFIYDTRLEKIDKLESQGKSPAALQYLKEMTLRGYNMSDAIQELHSNN
jgi:hypothetical protein